MEGFICIVYIIEKREGAFGIIKVDIIKIFRYCLINRICPECPIFHHGVKRERTGRKGIV